MYDLIPNLPIKEVSGDVSDRDHTDIKLSSIDIENENGSNSNENRSFHNLNSDTIAGTNLNENVKTINGLSSSSTSLLKASEMSVMNNGNVCKQRRSSEISLMDDLDIIVDISSPKKNQLQALLAPNFDKGSSTMLDTSTFSRSSSGRRSRGENGRIYHSPSQERSIDVV